MVLHVRGSTMLYEVQRRYFLVCVALAIPVVVQDGVKSMGYGDDCTLLKLFTNRLLDQGIGLHVNRRRRLVQHQDLGLPQQRSCQTHQLTLTHATNTRTHSVIVTSAPGSWSSSAALVPDTPAAADPRFKHKQTQRHRDVSTRILVYLSSARARHTSCR